MKVPLLDLKLQYQQLKGEIEPALLKFCAEQMCILGPHVEEFEKALAEKCGCRHACGMTSGSDALIIALMAEGIGAGDEVITSPYTFFATGGAIHRVGAKPVFVDIEPDTYTIDTAKIEEKVTPRTRAIIPVHLYGQTADMDAIMDIARRHDLIVIEDAAQAILSEYRGKCAGTIGDYGCTSFFPSKNLGCFGDGGAVLSQDDAKAAMIHRMRNHGMEPKYHHSVVGGNFRLDALQALVLNIKLKYLDGWTEKRQRNAAMYDSLFSSVDGLTTPVVAEWCTRHVRNQYIIRIHGGKRQKVWDALKAAEIGCDVYYPVPLHQQECFDYLGHKAGDFPESEKAAAETLAIPVYPDMTEEQVEYVASTVIGAL